MKILKVTTEHPAQFKTLIEVIKDVIPSTNIEFRRGDDDETTVKSSSESESDSNTESDTDTDTETESESEEDVKETKKGKKKEMKEQTGNKAGMRIIAVDNTRTILAYVKLEAKNFTEFICKKNKITIGVNMTNFHKLIKSTDKADIITLKLDSTDMSRLNILIDNVERKKNDSYMMNLLDLEESEINIPRITFDAEIIMLSSEFHKICREMSSYAEYVEIKCGKNNVIFSCKGDYAERETELKQSDTVNIKHTTNYKDGVVQGIFDLKHLVMFQKCAGLCNEIEIFMKNDYPLVIRYTVATLGKATFCLVPVQKNIKTNTFSDEEDCYSD